MQPKEDKKSTLNNALRYSGIGFQIAGALILGFAIGYGLDKWAHTSQPYFTLLFSVIFLGGGMYLAFRDLLKKS
ncbi:MAG: AtpZ/AtpI family protein [Chitinophagales bacterium]